MIISNPANDVLGKCDRCSIHIQKEECQCGEQHALPLEEDATLCSFCMVQLFEEFETCHGKPAENSTQARRHNRAMCSDCVSRAQKVRKKYSCELLKMWIELGR